MKITASNGKEYEINGNIVNAPNGKQYKVTKCEASIPAHVVRMMKGAAIPAGYVWSGEALLPHEVAEAAMAQTEVKQEIEGVAAILAAMADYEDAYAIHRDAIARGAARIPAMPATDKIDALKAMYPRAAAWVRADRYSMAHNASKAAAGRKARAAIENGEDYEAAIAAMEIEWSEAATKATDNN